MTDYATGGPIPAGSTPPELTRCLQETNRYIEENYGPDSGRAATLHYEAGAQWIGSGTVHVDLPAPPIQAYGDIEIKRMTAKDGSQWVAVTRADDLIGVSTEALHLFDMFTDDGYLVADTAGEYVYRPIRFAEQGRVVVCERVR